MTAHRIRATGAAFLFLASTAVVSPAWAQSGSDSGGAQLRFDLGLGVDWKSNRTLAKSDPGASTEAFVDLGFGLSSETRNTNLSFNLNGRLRGVDAPSSLDLSNGLINPSAALKYRRIGAASYLQLSARVTQSDLSDNRLIFDEDDGSFTIVDGNATRLNSTVEARVGWNEDARVSYGAFARYSDTSYSGGTATGVDGRRLSDAERVTVGGDVTFRLSHVAQLKTFLSYSNHTKSSVPDRETWSLGNTLTLARPTGDLSFSLDVTETENGTRTSAEIGRSYIMPRFTLSGQVGATNETSGNTVLTGGLGIEYPLPHGVVVVGLSRYVSSSNNEDEERLNTEITLGYKHALSKLSNLNFDALWAEAKDTSTDKSFKDASFGVSYTRALTQDWNLNLGVRHRYSDDTGEGKIESNEIFITMRRSYLTRF